MTIIIKWMIAAMLLTGVPLNNQQIMTDIYEQPANGINVDSLALQYLVKEPSVKRAVKKAIILLHGTGSNERDLFSLANQLPADFYIISPRAPYTLNADSYAWYQVDFSTGRPVINAAQEMSSRVLIRKFIEQLRKKYQLDEVYLGGFSQGAIMSYGVGLIDPAKVKGILCLSGRLLDEVKPFIKKTNQLQQLKVFIAHGTKDNVLTIQYAREAKKYLEDLSIGLSYHEYDMAHQLNNAVLIDINKWLLEN